MTACVRPIELELADWKETARMAEAENAKLSAEIRQAHELRWKAETTSQDLRAENAKLREQRDRLVEVFRQMTRCEPCDCGCPSKSQPILMKPQHYYAMARAILAEIGEGK